MWVLRNGGPGGPGRGTPSREVCKGVLRTPRAALRVALGQRGVVQRQRVHEVRVRAGGDARDGLLLEISESRTSGELLSVLRSNEKEIMSSQNTTVYLSEAWDVILQRHQDFRGSSGQSGPARSSEASGAPTYAADDPNALAEHLEPNSASNGNRQEMRTLQGYMLQHTMPLVPEFSPASISMIARAMVATNTGAAADIVSISSDVQSRLVRFEPRELCMVLWSLSSHPGMDERQKQELFKSLASLVRQGMGMDNFTAKDLSILVWAVGHVAFRDRVLLNAAEDEAVKKHAEFSAEDLSRLFHGFASVNYNPYTLLPHVCMRYSAPDALEEFASRDLALLTVSLGKLVVEPPSGFCKALVARARDLVPVTAKASSRVNARGGARSANGADVVQACDKFDVHLNALVMWSFARLGLKRTSYVTRSLKYVFLGSNLEQHAREDLIAVMWACCRLDVQLSSEQVARLSKTLNCTIGEERRGQDEPAANTPLRDEDQRAPALCRGFRYLSMLHSRRKDAGRDPDSDKSTNSNAHRIVDEIFSGGLAENISPWEVASVVVALGALSESSKGSPKSKPLPLRRIQRYLTVSIPAVDSSLLPKLTYTVAKLGLATNNAAVVEALSSAIVAKSGIIPAQGLVQVAYSYASMGSRGVGGAANDVARAVAPKLMDGARHLSPKDRARAIFSVYQLAKQSGDRDKDLHLVCKDMLLRHMTEADVASLDASTAFGLCLAFGSVAARHGTKERGAIRQLRGWIVKSFLTRVHGITSPKQLAGIQKVMIETKGYGGEQSSTADTNLDELLATRLSQLR